MHLYTQVKRFRRVSSIFERLAQHAANMTVTGFFSRKQQVNRPGDNFPETTMPRVMSLAEFTQL